MFAVVLDEEAALVAGLPVGALNTVLAVLAAVTVVAGMRVVGVLLVAALNGAAGGVGPTAGDVVAAALRWAMAIGVACVVVGLTAARALDVAPGGTIVLVAAAVFGVTSLVGARR